MGIFLQMAILVEVCKQPFPE
eukprot:SAG31_NODE_1669_length_7575_cov_2.213483_5_plen_20_part_01